jgi:hypothetical protein
MNVIEIIDKFNLSIRRLPDKVINCYDMRHHKEGNKIITANNGRQFSQKTTIPEHHGWYMCKQINNTMSMVRWSYKEDNLSPTLEGSVEMFLTKNNLAEFKE